ncbi:protein of unknown function [Cyanobium sp. NIES-981]|nr:protein of unknown function [Cyanobium sp. NIES-981]
MAPLPAQHSLISQHMRFFVRLTDLICTSRKPLRILSTKGRYWLIVQSQPLKSMSQVRQCGLSKMPLQVIHVIDRNASWSA